VECGKEKMWECCCLLFDKKILKRYSSSAQYRDARRTKEIKKLGRVLKRVKKIFPRAILVTRAVGSSALI
jgi:hypothetical protein